MDNLCRERESGTTLVIDEQESTTLNLVTMVIQEMLRTMILSSQVETTIMMTREMISEFTQTLDIYFNLK